MTTTCLDLEMRRGRIINDSTRLAQVTMLRTTRLDLEMRRIINDFRLAQVTMLRTIRLDPGHEMHHQHFDQACSSDNFPLDDHGLDKYNMPRSSGETHHQSSDQACTNDDHLQYDPTCPQDPDRFLEQAVGGLEQQIQRRIIEMMYRMTDSWHHRSMQYINIVVEMMAEKIREGSI